MFSQIITKSCLGKMVNNLLNKGQSIFSFTQYKKNTNDHPSVRLVSVQQILSNSIHHDYEIKGSSLKYKYKDHQMLTYFIHPQINSSSNNIHQILQSTALNISFLDETTEELAEIAWENRKTFTFAFKQVLQFLKIPLFSEKREQIIQHFEGQGNDLLKKIRIIDSPSTKSIILLAYEAQIKNNEEEISWQKKFELSYQDFQVFVLSIKKNTFYISGASFMIELTKEKEIIKVEKYDKKQVYVKKNQTVAKEIKKTDIRPNIQVEDQLNMELFSEEDLKKTK